MKKTKLIGKKLYRTGPLKLFKSGLYGDAGKYGGTYGYGGSSGRDSSHRPGGSGYRASVRSLEKAQKQQAAAALQYQQQKREEEAKRKAAIKKKAEDLLNDNSPEGQQKLRNARDLGDPDLKAAVNNRLNEIQGQKTGAAKQKKLDEKVSQNQLKNLLKKVVRGTIVKVGGVVMDAYDAIRDNPDDTTVNKLVDNLGIGHVDPKTITVSDKEVQEELDSGDYDNPENPNKFEGSSYQTQAAAKPKPGSGGGQGGKVTGIAIPGVAGGPIEAKGPAAPAAPATPAPPSAMEQLQRRARGEDSIVEKEGEIARQKALSSQLASLKGARGATAGQKLRALRRGQEDVGVKLGSQIALGKAKEQEAAQKEIRDLDEAQKERDLRLKMAKEKGTGGVSLGAAPSKGQSFGQKIQTGLDIYKKGKKIWDEGKKIGSDFGWWNEGGFVSGPGSETSDSIPARLSDGEFVVKASAVRGLGKQLGAKDKDEERQKGVDFLYKLQDKMDKAKKFKDGGPVSASKLKDKLIGPLRVGMFGPGKMSDEERLEASDRKMKGKIRELKDEEINDNINKLMEELNKRNRKKLKVPKSKNEEKVKKLLEKKSKKSVIKPKSGKFWKEEEKLSMAKGGEAYVRPKKAFREAIGYEPESRFHDKALKDAKFGGARRKFRHFKQGGEVSFGSVVSAKKRLNKNLEKLKRK